MQNIILQCAIKAALLAGQDILDVYNDPNADFNIERKADNSPLTIADRLSHKRIASLLKETPYPILSELSTRWMAQKSSSNVMVNLQSILH